MALDCASVRECHPKLAGGRVYLQPFSLVAPVSLLTGYAASDSSVVVGGPVFINVPEVSFP